MFLHEVTGTRAGVETISKLEVNRKGRCIATLRNGSRVLLRETLEEAQKLVDKFKSTAYLSGDDDLGGPAGEQLIDETGKPIF